jgi:hypothetical protein
VLLALLCAAAAPGLFLTTRLAGCACARKLAPCSTPLTRLSAAAVSFLLNTLHTGAVMHALVHVPARAGRPSPDASPSLAECCCCLFLLLVEQGMLPPLQVMLPPPPHLAECCCRLLPAEHLHAGAAGPGQVAAQPALGNAVQLRTQLVPAAAAAAGTGMSRHEQHAFLLESHQAAC